MDLIRIFFTVRKKNSLLLWFFLLFSQIEFPFSSGTFFFSAMEKSKFSGRISSRRKKKNAKWNKLILPFSPSSPINLILENLFRFHFDDKLTVTFAAQCETFFLTEEMEMKIDEERKFTIFQFPWEREKLIKVCFFSRKWKFCAISHDSYPIRENPKIWN